MRRGDIVTAVFAGAYGKPRPALLIQHDAFEALPSATVLPITSDLRDLPLIRIDIDMGPQSGLPASLAGDGGQGADGSACQAGAAGGHAGRARSTAGGAGAEPIPPPFVAERKFAWTAELPLENRLR